MSDGAGGRWAAGPVGRAGGRVLGVARRVDGAAVDGDRRPDPQTAPSPTRFCPVVPFDKDEVFEICAALALGEAVLGSLGRGAEAAHLAAVFEMAEGRLAS